MTKGASGPAAQGPREPRTQHGTWRRRPADDGRQRPAQHDAVLPVERRERVLLIGGASWLAWWITVRSRCGGRGAALLPSQPRRACGRTRRADGHGDGVGHQRARPPPPGPSLSEAPQHPPPTASLPPLLTVLAAWDAHRGPDLPRGDGREGRATQGPGERARGADGQRCHVPHHRVPRVAGACATAGLRPPASPPGRRLTVRPRHSLPVWTRLGAVGPGGPAGRCGLCDGAGGAPGRPAAAAAVPRLRPARVRTRATGALPTGRVLA